MQSQSEQAAGGVRYERETPFLDRYEPEQEETASEDRSSLTSAVTKQMETPFTSFYEVGEGEQEGTDPQRAFYAQLLSELHDETFEESIHELVQEASAVYEDRFNQELGDPAAQRMAAENMVRDYLAPLARDAEQLVDSVAQGLAENDVSAMTENEFEALLSQYEPSGENLSPAFEGFLKGLWKKVKKVAKGVASAVKSGVAGVSKLAGQGLKLAGKLAMGPFGFVFDKLKGMIKPLLERVLKMAIGKLPPALQPAAQMLARKFFGTVPEEPSSAQEGDLEGEEAAPEVSQLQDEMDVQLANMLMDGETMEAEMAAAEYANPESEQQEEELEQVGEAREKFAEQIGNLRDGESAQPAMEEFIPAILPAVKLGIRIIGRKRVVDFLAEFLAKLVAKLVGPTYAKPLSASIVEVGMGMLGLEVTPEQESRVAGQAIANAVEETIQRVAGLPDEVLENEEVLEAAVAEAFESAAASNFPSKAIHPHLREGITEGVWVPMPVRSGMKRYKKYSVVFDKVLAPNTLAKVLTFGGRPLSRILRDQYGIDPRKSIRARIHLYEAMRGTRLSHITILERRVRGLGNREVGARKQIHPLTPEAAGALLGDPGLGKTVSQEYLQDRRVIGLGQRFYYLEIDGARAVTPNGQAGRPGVRRSSRGRVTIDFPASKVIGVIYLSEEDAREVARRLNDPKATLSSTLMGFGGVIDAMAGNVAAGRGLRVIHETEAFEQFSPLVYKTATRMIRGGGRSVRPTLGAIVPSGILGRGRALVNRLSTGLRSRVATKIANWCRVRVLEFLKSQKAEFSRAVDNPADGVTLIITFTNPPLLGSLNRILRGRVAGELYENETAEIPSANVQIVPGYSRG